jgi:hypothetical protein
VIFNVAVLVVSAATGILNIDPSIIISFNGAICAFFIVYVLPIAIHMRMLYGDKDQLIKSIVEGEHIKDPQKKSELEESLQHDIANQQKERDVMPAWLRWLGFGPIFAYGAFVLGLQLRDIYQDISHKLT